MKELEALSNQIIERVTNEGKEKIHLKEQELNNLMEENRIRLDHQKSRKQVIEARNQAEYERQVQSLNNEKRNKLLAEKQTILNEVYQQATKKMSEWDDATFQQFVLDALTQFEFRSIQLTIGEKSVSSFTDKIQKQLQEKFPNVELATEAAPKKAGFIVSVGGVDYNFFFDQMVEEIKRDFSPRLAALAFQKAGEE